MSVFVLYAAFPFYLPGCHELSHTAAEPVHTHLVDEVPLVLRRHIEHLWRSAVACTDWRLVEVVVRGCVRRVKVGEAEVDEIVTGRLCRTGEDVVLPVVVDDGRVLESSNVAAIALRADEGTAGAPFEAGGNSGLSECYSHQQ